MKKSHQLIYVLLTLASFACADGASSNYAAGSLATAQACTADSPCQTGYVCNINFAGADATAGSCAKKCSLADPCPSDPLGRDGCKGPDIGGPFACVAVPTAEGETAAACLRTGISC